MNNQSSSVLDRVREVIAQDFDIEPSRITQHAKLYDDLELDSIDAVDLIDRLRQITGKTIAPEHFREARTVADVVSLIQSL